MTGYEYDGLNRLTWAGEYHDTTEPEDGYVVYGVSYGYDRWGNRVCGGQGWRAGWADRASVGALARRGPDGRRVEAGGRPVGSDEPIRQGAPGCVAVGVDGGTNRLVGSGIGYDANGNLTWDGVTGQGLRAYDGENRLVQAAGEGGGLWRYVYDADGRRVKLNVGRGDERWLVYGLDGAVVAEYGAQGAGWQPVVEYGYRNGELLVIGEGWRCRWVVSDVVGSVRLSVDQTGSAAGVKRRDYMPYGEDLGAGVGGRSAALGYEAAAPSDPRKKYGTYERDDGTGLDYAQARYYQSRLGRFTSVDGFAGGPEEVAVLGSGDGARQALPYGDLTRPQSLNGYQYCYQNPLRYRDPGGHIPVETAIDVVSFGASFYQLVTNPSWVNFGYVLWDGVAIAVPYVPGSWVAKVGKYGYSGLKAAGIVRKLDDFETVVNNKFIREGVGLLGQGDESVRKVLDMPTNATAADFLGIRKGGEYVIAEAKGSGLARAVVQLDNTARALVAKQGNVKFSAEIVLRKGQKIESDFRVSGNQLEKFNARTQKWELQKANDKAITVRYEEFP